MPSGSCLEKLIVFCIFMQYEIRPVLKIKSQSMPVALKKNCRGIASNYGSVEICRLSWHFLFTVVISYKSFSSKYV